jgi:hypothetical protein
MRFWIVPVRDAQGGTALWVGGTANRNRDAFEMKFKTLVEQIQKELKPEFGATTSSDTATSSRTMISRTTLAGR